MARASQMRLTKRTKVYWTVTFAHPHSWPRYSGSKRGRSHCIASVASEKKARPLPCSRNGA